MTRETVRMDGMLQASPRGPLIRDADGTLWRLKAEQEIAHLHGRAITVKGVREGIVITAYYIASLPAQTVC